MAVTTTKTIDLRYVINAGNLNDEAAALRLMKHGNMHSVIKATFASLSAAASVDITTATSKSKATVTGITLDTGENLPAIGAVISLRVTAGSASAAVRTVTDSGGTATTAIAKISDDGKTLTFEDTLTGFVLTYIPRGETAPTTAFPMNAP